VIVSSGNPHFADQITGVQAVVPDFELVYDRSKTARTEFENFAPSAQALVGTQDTYESAIAVWPFTDPYEVNEHDYEPLLWGLDAVGAYPAWDAGNTGAGVVVAVLDGGFDLDHPDFPDYQGEMSFVPGQGVVYDIALDPDAFSHGSHVAGTIAAPANGFGVTGVAPEATIMPVKVLEDSGSGDFSWVIAGIYYAAMNGADVINMSLGASIPQGVQSDANDVAGLRVAMNRAVTFAYRQGTTVITSAGNDSNDSNRDRSLVVFPADMPHAISISALGPEGIALDPGTDLDTLAIYSNYGFSGIDFAAPGGDYEWVTSDPNSFFSLCLVADTVDLCGWFDWVLSLNDSSYEWAVGTSMAAPHAAGIAALIIAENGGEMHPGQVEAKMLQLSEDLGKPGNDPIYGNGRVHSGY
jgi:subtilisin family serine protease